MGPNTVLLKKASFWYLERQDYPQEVDLPDEKETKEKLMKIGKKIRLARQMDRFLCPKGEAGCRYCSSLEAVVSGQGKLVGTDDFGADLYFLEDGRVKKRPKSRIL